jgi:hypothetical protein
VTIAIYVTVGLALTCGALLFAHGSAQRRLSRRRGPAQPAEPSGPAEPEEPEFEVRRERIGAECSVAEIEAVERVTDPLGASPTRHSDTSMPRGDASWASSPRADASGASPPSGERRSTSRSAGRVT